MHVATPAPRSLGHLKPSWGSLFVHLACSFEDAVAHVMQIGRLREQGLPQAPARAGRVQRPACLQRWNRCCEHPPGVVDWNGRCERWGRGKRGHDT